MQRSRPVEYNGNCMLMTSVNDISGDLLTTINGEQSSYFTTRRDQVLEQKDDQIEQLKA